MRTPGRHNVALGGGITALVLVCAIPAGSRVVAGIQVGPGPSVIPYGEELGLVPPSDRDVESWLRRAEGAARRGDWKLAADTLARVIDEHGHKTVSLDDGQHYTSAVWCAQRQMAGWPEEGKAVYRQLYDAEVRRLLEDAKATHDLDGLLAISRTYPLSTPGPEAINLAVGWLLDQRRGSEALELLDQLAHLPDCRVPRWEILLKSAVARALDGQAALAAEAVAEMRGLDADAGEVLPDDWGRRVAMVARFVDSVRDGEGGKPRQEDRLETSRLAGAEGRSAAINPAVTAEAAWHDALPGADALDMRLAMEIVERTGRPTVWQAVSDGQSLFVTSPGGLIARDLATFDFLWRAMGRVRPRDPRIVRHRLDTGTWTVDNSGNLDALTTQTLFHEYRGAVSTAMGLVFVIEQERTPGEQFPTRQGVLPLRRVVSADALGVANSLRAFEADTGRVVWTKGRGGVIGDELKSAHFYSTPVVAGSYLIVPYLEEEDFLLAVLRRDGSLAKRVLLGSTRLGVLPMNGVLQPTVCDGTVYVATGAGLVVALNATDFSLKWLTRYARSDLARLAGGREVLELADTVILTEADGWLSSPPLVAAGLVVISPHDGDHLVAFDRRTGVEQWAHARGRHRYVIGADGRHVLIGGERVISAVRLTDGAEAWTHEGVTPSGRPAICGERVLVPTREGLLTLDLRTGEPVGEFLATSEPLGNLVAVGGALYSVGAKEVSKFPDVKRLRTMALARLEQDAGDADAVLQLASLAMLEKDWAAALSWLDKMGAAVGEETGARIAHARVVALMELAKAAEIEEQALLLEQAFATAGHSVDKLTAGLALCDVLVEQGELTAAFMRAFGLLRAAGDEAVALEPHLNVRADVVIGERLGRMWGDLSDAQRAELRPRIAGAVDAGLSSGRVAAAVQLSDVLAFLPDVGARLDLELGKRAVVEGALESGVFHLRRAAVRGRGGDVGVEAAARLADAMTRPGDGLPRAPVAGLDAGALAARGNSENSGPETPASPGNTGETPMLPVKTTGGTPMLPAKTTGETPAPHLCVGTHGGAAGGDRLPAILRARGALRLVDEEVNISTGRGTAASFYDPIQLGDVFSEVLPIGISGQIKGLRVGAGGGDRVYWASELEPIGGGGVGFYSALAEFDVLPMAVSGRVGVFGVGSQLCAIGLTSGRAMWQPLGVDFSEGRLPNPPVLAVGGMIVSAADSQTLIAVPAREDGQPAWRRHFPAYRLGVLAEVVGGVVVDPRALDAERSALPVGSRLRSRAEITKTVDPPNGKPVGRQFTGFTEPGSEGGTIGHVIPARCLTVPHGRDVSVGELAVVDRNATELTVLDVGTGRVVRRLALGAKRRKVERSKGVTSGDGDVGALGMAGLGLGVEDADAHVAVVGHVVCRSGFKRVVGRDIRDGRMVWDLALSGLVKEVRALGERCVGVCYRGHRYAVVDVGSGDVLGDFVVDDLTMPPLRAALDRTGEGADGSWGRLLLFSVTEEEPAECVLVSVPVRANEEGDASGLDGGPSRWDRRLGRFASISRRMMAASPDYLAVVQYRVGSGGTELVSDGRGGEAIGRQSGLEGAMLLVLDKKTGDRLIPRPYRFDEGRMAELPLRSHAITDVVVLDRRIVAVAPEGYYVLAREGLGGGAESP